MSFEESSAFDQCFRNIKHHFLRLTFSNNFIKELTLAGILTEACRAIILSPQYSSLNGSRIRKFLDILSTGTKHWEFIVFVAYRFFTGVDTVEGEGILLFIRRLLSELSYFLPLEKYYLALTAMVVTRSMSTNGEPEAQGRANSCPGTPARGTPVVVGDLEAVRRNLQAWALQSSSNSQGPPLTTSAPIYVAAKGQSSGNRSSRPRDLEFLRNRTPTGGIRNNRTSSTHNPQVRFSLADQDRQQTRNFDQGSRVAIDKNGCEFRYDLPSYQEYLQSINTAHQLGVNQRELQSRSSTIDFRPTDLINAPVGLDLSYHNRASQQFNGLNQAGLSIPQTHNMNAMHHHNMVPTFSNHASGSVCAPMASSNYQSALPYTNQSTTFQPYPLHYSTPNDGPPSFNLNTLLVNQPIQQPNYELRNHLGGNMNQGYNVHQSNQGHTRAPPLVNAPQMYFNKNSPHLKAMSVPRYSGPAEHKTPYDFLVELEKYQIITQTSDTCMVNEVVPLALEGQAFVWYRFEIRNGNFIDWNDFKERFRREFQVLGYEYELSRELETRTQAPEEPLSAYIRVILDYFERLGSHLTEEDMVKRIKRGMHPEYLQMLQGRRINSIRDMVLYASEAQELIKAYRSYKPPPSGSAVEPTLQWRQNDPNVSSIRPSTSFSDNGKPKPHSNAIDPFTYHHSEPSRRNVTFSDVRSNIPTDYEPLSTSNPSNSSRSIPGRGQSPNRPATPVASERRCYACNSTEHLRNECPTRSPKTSGNGQIPSSPNRW